MSKKAEVPIEVKERNPETSPDLTDKRGVAWWGENFGTKTIVSNKEFEEKLAVFLEDEKVFEDGIDQENFCGLICLRILVPDPTLYETNPKLYNKGQVPRSKNFVDMYCIQFTTNIFGPFRQVFHFIYNQFQCSTMTHKGLDFFHGRVSKKAADKILGGAKVNSYLLRYKQKTTCDDNKAGLLLCYTCVNDKTGNLMVREMQLYRKGPYKIKEKKFPPGWTWTEKIARIGGFTEKTRKCRTLEEFLDQQKTKIMLGDPVMASSAYKVVDDPQVFEDGDEDNDTSVSPNVESILDGLDIRKDM